jgi:hypothetical protein
MMKGKVLEESWPCLIEVVSGYFFSGENEENRAFECESRALQLLQSAV